MIQWQDISGNLQSALFDQQRAFFHSELDSTNQTAIELAREGAPEGTLVVADSQRSGRGRLQRIWQSPPGVNLYFSMVLRPELAIALAPQVTLLTGVALAESAVMLKVPDVALKWPNDLLIKDRKSAGILTEMGIQGHRINYLVVGVGINVYGQVKTLLPEALHTSAITWSEALDDTGVDHSGFNLRGKILNQFLNQFSHWYTLWQKEGFIPIRTAWMNRAGIIGKRVQINLTDRQFSGIAINMDPEGYLMVKDGVGIVQQVMAGDVTLMKE
ncbi:MAG: biotin--[acetyl-CoA-carboxylase] ligase [Magnetococcales bacterium]|nr:biotin--[acetyl-CoA-carboxylase] ligase [Magnetococcales bacterium]